MALEQQFEVNNSGILEVDGSAVTQPVSAASLPLPSGAATETTLAALNTKVTTTANGVKTDGSAVTQPVSASSLPLPTGASTAAKQPAFGTAGTASADVVTVQGVAGATPIPVIEGLASTSTITSISSSLTTAVVLAANANRKGLIFYAEGAKCFLAYAATASTTAYTVQIPANSYFEPEYIYTGAISAVFSAVGGFLRTTQLT